jgi:hypothetical protein
MEIISINDINLLDIGNTIQLGGMIWVGPNICFVTQVPQRKDDLSQLKMLPMTLEDWERFLRQLDILETEIFTQDPTGIVKKLVRKSQRQIEGYVQWAVFQRDHYTCRYCGRTGIPLSVDHIILWEEGGASIMDNLLSACKACNRDRGNTPYEKWITSSLYHKKSGDLRADVVAANLAIIPDLPRLATLKNTHQRSR